MQVYHHVEPLAKALYSALQNNFYLPDISYEHQTLADRKSNRPGKMRLRRPYENEVICHHFTQTWASTSMGFGGIGGAAMTTAYTTVVELRPDAAAVLFNGQHAYTIEKPNENFWKDVKEQNMAYVSDSHKYKIQNDGNESSTTG